jgi:hypothetical protein
MEGKMYIRDAATAEAQVALQFASMTVWALQMKFPPLHQPFNLEVNACIDEPVEMPISVLE